MVQLSILDSALYAIIVTDFEGKVTYVNNAASKLLGYENTELLGYNFNVLLDLFEVMEKNQTLNDELNAQVDTGFPTVIERTKRDGGEVSRWTLIDKDKNRIIANLAISFLVNQKGDREGFLFFARDITQQHELEQKIEAHRKSLMEAAQMASIGEMAMTVAHEINNPLTIIVGKIDRLLGNVESDRTTKEMLLKDLTKVKENASRIAKIVKSLYPDQLKSQ